MFALVSLSFRQLTINARRSSAPFTSSFWPLARLCCTPESQLFLLCACLLLSVSHTSFPADHDLGPPGGGDYFLDAREMAFQDFLLTTSILDRLGGPLCDAVTPSRNGLMDARHRPLIDRHLRRSRCGRRTGSMGAPRVRSRHDRRFSAGMARRCSSAPSGRRSSGYATSAGAHACCRQDGVRRDRGCLGAADRPQRAGGGLASRRRRGGGITCTTRSSLPLWPCARRER